MCKKGKKPHLIDKADEMGRTPLQIACLEGHFELGTYLFSFMNAQCLHF